MASTIRFDESCVDFIWNLFQRFNSRDYSNITRFFFFYLSVLSFQSRCIKIVFRVFTGDCFLQSSTSSSTSKHHIKTRVAAEALAADNNLFFPFYHYTISPFSLTAALSFIFPFFSLLLFSFFFSGFSSLHWSPFPFVHLVAFFLHLSINYFVNLSVIVSIFISHFFVLSLCFFYFLH